MNLSKEKLSPVLVDRAELIVGHSLIVTDDFKRLTDRVLELFDECELLLKQNPNNEILKYNYNELYILQLLMMVGSIRD